MYTMRDEEGYIISYIHGYEAGRNGRCDFSSRVSELLEKEFNHKKGALGWNGQISEYGKKEDLTWETSFKKIGIKVLSEYFQSKSKKRFEKIIKSIIQSKIDQINVLVEYVIKSLYFFGLFIFKKN